MFGEAECLLRRMGRVIPAGRIIIAGGTDDNGVAEYANHLHNPLRDRMRWIRRFAAAAALSVDPFPLH